MYDVYLIHDIFMACLLRTQVVRFILSYPLPSHLNFLESDSAMLSVISSWYFWAAQLINTSRFASNPPLISSSFYPVTRIPCPLSFVSCLSSDFIRDEDTVDPRVNDESEGKRISMRRAIDKQGGGFNFAITQFYIGPNRIRCASNESIVILFCRHREVEEMQIWLKHLRKRR